VGGNVEMVKLMIDNGANYDKLGRNGETVLYAACWSNNVDLVKYLIDEVGMRNGSESS